MTAPARKLGVGDRLHVVKCNHCGSFVLNEHRASHALDCRSKRNRVKLSAVNLEKDGKFMYAVVASRRRRGQWSAPEINYVHAENPQHARAQFLAGENKNTTYVLETGLAIGWFQDEQGRITG